MEYVYELMEVSSEKHYESIAGIFTEDELDNLKTGIEHNAYDMWETVHDYIFIKKIPLNRIYPLAEEMYIYKFAGNNSYKLHKLVIGVEECMRATNEVFGGFTT